MDVAQFAWGLLAILPPTRTTATTSVRDFYGPKPNGTQHCCPALKRIHDCWHHRASTFIVHWKKAFSWALSWQVEVSRPSLWLLRARKESGVKHFAFKCLSHRSRWTDWRRISSNEAIVMTCAGRQGFQFIHGPFTFDHLGQKLFQLWLLSEIVR